VCPHQETHTQNTSTTTVQVPTPAPRDPTTKIRNAEQAQLRCRQALTEKMQSQLARFKGHVRLSDFSSDKVPDTSGVYIIGAVTRTGRPIPLRRLNGIDAAGILCIGKSKDVRRRIREFVADIRTPRLGTAYHSAGWNFCAYFRDNPRRDIIRLAEENLEATWKTTARDRHADHLETQLLQAYVKKYQDKPPLNISIKRG